MVFPNLNISALFLKNRFLAINFEKSFLYTKFFQKVSYNNSKLPTKGFLEERNWPVVTIFHLFFSIADFCQPQLTNPLQFQYKTYFDQDFLLNQSRTHINYAEKHPKNNLKNLFSLKKIRVEMTPPLAV